MPAYNDSYARIFADIDHFEYINSTLHLPYSDKFLINISLEILQTLVKQKQFNEKMWIEFPEVVIHNKSNKIFLINKYDKSVAMKKTFVELVDFFFGH